MILEALATIAALSSEGDVANSPFIVPVAGCIMVAVIVIASTVASSRKREIESQERLAAIAKGLTPPPTIAELERSQVRPISSANRRYSNIRLTGIILLGGALGLILFFVILAWVLQTSAILSGAAASLIPLGLGIGFLFDAYLQKRDLEAAGIDVSKELGR